MFDMSVPWWEMVVRGVVVYVFLIVLLRVTGKRQIGQLSPLDLVLLLILSNAVQNSMNAGDNSLIGGLISAATLVAVNYLIEYAATRSKRLEEAVEGRPEIIIHEGQLFEEVIKKAQITHLEVESALRTAGFFNIKDVKLAILENNGKVSVQGYEKK